MAGGLFPVDSICSIHDMSVWLDDECQENPSDCFAFYGTLGGDNMCFKADGTALWYAHEMGNFKPFGATGEFLDAYFTALLEGRELGQTY